MRIKLSAAAVVAVIIAACSSPTSVCGCSPPVPSIEAFGTMRTAAGAPVSTAILSIAGTRGNCAASGPRVTFRTLDYTIGATGQYRALIIPSEPDSICARITARRSADSGADSVVSAGFVFAVGGANPSNSVRVDLIFP